MLAAETRAVERGTTFADLMEKAGSESARIIYDNYCADKKNVLIISGRGKNGGDGFVISRYLTHMNCNTLVLLPCGKPSDEISLNNLNLLDEGTVYVSGARWMKNVPRWLKPLMLPEKRSSVSIFLPVRYATQQKSSEK